MLAKNLDPGFHPRRVLPSSLGAGLKNLHFQTPPSVVVLQISLTVFEKLDFRGFRRHNFAATLYSFFS